MTALIRAACALVFFASCVAARPAGADEVTIPQHAGVPEITGILAKPTGPGPFPAVLVLHGCAGPGRLERELVAELARAGYVGLTIDTLKPQGVSNACAGAAKGASRLSARYAAESLAWLAAQRFVRGDRLGVIGFSMGAIAILDLTDPFLDAPPPPGLRVAVAYYPACRGRNGAATVPLLILDGDEDDWTPAPPCQAMAKAAAAAGKPVEITTYPGATHNFNTPRASETTYLGHKLRYDPDAAHDAAERTKAFLARYL